MPNVWTVVVAAGTGSRFGGPKQFETLGGRRVLEWSVATAKSASQGVVVVLPPGHGGVEGGATRSASVRNGLAHVPAQAEIVCIHDAARPFASEELFARVVNAVIKGADGDVIAHAVADALLGAAGLGDLGEHFPDTDPRWAGADSIALLGDVVKLVHDANWRPANVDCSVVCERPRLALHRAAIQGVLSDAVGAPVTVKGRRAEGLGALGRAEGVACWAVALVERP